MPRSTFSTPSSRTSLPKYGGFIVCVRFCDDKGYTVVEMIGYENIQDIYPEGDTLVFKSVGCKLYAIVEPSGYLLKSVEPVNRPSDQMVPYRFSELLHITTKRFRASSRPEAGVHADELLGLQAQGEDLAVLFYDIADVYTNIQDFLIMILRDRLGCRFPTPGRRRRSLRAASGSSASGWTRPDMVDGPDLGRPPDWLRRGRLRRGPGRHRDLRPRAVPGDAVNDASPALGAGGGLRRDCPAGAAGVGPRRPPPLVLFRAGLESRPRLRGLVRARGQDAPSPPEGRELKRLLSALAEDARERGAGDATFSGLVRLEAEFSWKTSGFEVSQVCRRIAQLLAQAGFYDDRAGEDECALALEEALVNSIEHGNLALDSSLRPDQPLAEDIYEAERDRRLADPAYGGRLIGIRLSIADGRAEIVLEDQGEGFDTTKMDEGPSGLDVSGKGFWLIRRPFDSASYNEKGNSLTLSKRRRSASPKDAPDSWR